MMTLKELRARESVVTGYLEKHAKDIFKARELARVAGVTKGSHQLFRQVLKEWADQGRLSRYQGNKFGVLKKKKSYVGILHVKTQGFGFLIREDGGEDIFISQKNMNTALHRDRVRVELWAQPMGRLGEGRVVEILERGQKQVVGTFKQSRNFNYMVPDELKFNRDISIPNGQTMNAKPGQKVVVRMTQWENARQMPEGRIVKVLGFPNEKGVDVLSVAYGFDLPLDIPKPVEDEIRDLPKKLQASDYEGRKDLRDLLLFTIDPEDAKDHDDAVSLTIGTDGRRTLGVHIADVSHFVPIGSATDKEALMRATSVYLVDRVIPMLPESLSNHLCSLKPDEDRLAFSVMMTYDKDGRVEDYEIHETVIRSRYKLNYQQVQRFFDGQNSISVKGESSTKPAYPFQNQQLKQVLTDMRTLSRQIREQFHQAGSIEFSAPEPKVVLDEKGRPIQLGVREQLESHQLIESFMLAANQTVASHIKILREKTGKKYPFVYRIHEKPKGEKLDKFLGFVKAMGFSFDAGKKITPKKFQRFLQEIQGSKHALVIEEVALRSMMKARYSTANVGHFGLAFTDYTHFTSPIRRYPDLMVHRLIKSYLKNGERPAFPATLSRICEIASDREIAAQKAERESIKAKQVEFMEKHIGDVFDGIISGVTSFGIFVEIPEYLTEGLVHVEDLDDDYYEYDEKNYQLTGKRQNRIYRLGDEVTVQVSRVLREMKKLDFTLLESKRYAGKKAGKKSKKRSG